MKYKNVLAAAIFTGLSIIVSTGYAQQSLWFGTVKKGDKVAQGRFEVTGDSIITSIIYAPYGLTPISFKEVRQQKNGLTFKWQAGETIYNCLLIKQDNTAFTGTCTGEKAQPIHLVVRQFAKEDAVLQGDALHASPKDIRILERALILLNNGINWNRFDNRVCDNSLYPYRWSLFCALHQASIEVDSEYRHLRPAMQAARQAINEITKGKQYAHLLQDFNNEAPDFASIEKLLTRAKELIVEKIRLQQ